MKNVIVDYIEAAFVILDNCKINTLKCCYCEIKNNSHINEIYFIDNYESDTLYISPLSEYNGINNSSENYLVYNIDDKIKLNNYIVCINSTINEINGNDILYGYLNKSSIMSVNMKHKIKNIDSSVFGDRNDNV